MKNIMLLGLILICFSIGYSQSFEKFDTYFGISSTNVSTTDFKNFHISDWEAYGLGSGEGRVAVPLGDNDIAGQNLSILVGGISPLYSRIDAIVEGHVGLGSISYIAGFAGINLKLINGESFKLGITPKFGYTSVLADFGTVEVLPGKTPPVILSEGKFNVGDKLSMDLSGLGINIGATASLHITKSIGIIVSAGYQLSFAGDPKIKAGEINIPMDSDGVVKNDFSSSQAGLNPTASVSGISFQAGIIYGLDFLTKWSIKKYNLKKNKKWRVTRPLHFLLFIIL